MQLIVDSLVTNYQTLGSGKKIALFLHGWADKSQTFDPLAKEFIKENQDFTAVLVDLPGFGKTDTPTSAWGLHDYALFVSSFLKKAKLKPQVIIGHSNGGAIAIEGLAEEVFSADKLILIGSAGVRKKSTKGTFLKIASVPAKALLMVLPDSVGSRIKKRAYSAIGSDYMVAGHMQETFKKVVSQDLRSKARKLRVPTVLIYGTEDTATPPEYGKDFAELIPGAELHLIPEAGHFVHQEQVYKVATIIAEHIQ